MIFRVHKTADNRTIVAICDTDLLGTRVEEGVKLLDLTVDFYKGEEGDEKTIILVTKGANIVNAVGSQSIAVLRRAGIVQGTVPRIKNIPYVQLILT